MKPSAHKSTAGRHILIYGPPKTGKTILAAKLCELDFKLWWFDGEDGFKSVFAVDKDGKPFINPAKIEENIEYFPIMDNSMVPMFAETMLKIVRKDSGLRNICHRHGKVECMKCKAAGLGSSSINLDTFTNKDILVIDSGSQLAESMMNQIARGTAATEEDYKPERDDYMKQGFLGNRIYSRIQTAPFNVIVITHEVIVELPDKTKKIYPVGGTGNYSKKFGAFFDEIIYAEKSNFKMNFYSNALHANHIALGSRSGKMIEKADEKSLAIFFE